MDVRYIEGIAASLVREFLNRKGLMNTLARMDEEFPRAENSISNRQELMKTLHLETLMKKNKETPDPLRTMIEVITKYFLEISVGNERPRSSKNRHKNVQGIVDMKPAEDSSIKDITHEMQKNSKTRPESSNKNSKSEKTTITKSGDLLIEDNLESETMLGDGKSGLFDQETSVDYCPLALSQKPKERPKSGLRNVGMAGPMASNHEDMGKRKMHRPRPLSGTGIRGVQKESALKNETDGNDNDDSKSKAALDQSKHQDLRKIETIISKPIERKSSIQDILSVEDQSKNQKMSSRRQNSQEKDESHYSVHESSIAQRPPTRGGLSDSRKSSTTSSSSAMSKVGDVEIGEMDDLEEEVRDLDLGPRLPVYNRAIHNLIDARPITLQTAATLKTLIFGAGNQNFNDEWRYQSFTFCDIPGLQYGIVQKKGGPCGVLAAVQACLLQELLFGDSKVNIDRFQNPTKEERSNCLAIALSKIFWRAGQRKYAVVALPSGKIQFQGGRGKYKCDDLTETLMLNHFKKYDDLLGFVKQNIYQFESDGNGGVILALYSTMFSRFLDQIKEDMDEPAGKLMGAHGYCTQDMVNLFLTGRAVSNVFNDTIELDSGDSSGDKTVLKGPNARCNIGLLSLFEHYKSCQVGTYYKTPKFPIWVICSESHFSVLFSIKKELLSNWKAEKYFHLYYYDGLSRQQEEIKLTIDTNKKYHPPASEDELVPPIEHCIRTKWPEAVVDWNGTEPLL